MSYSITPRINTEELSLVALYYLLFHLLFSSDACFRVLTCLTLRQIDYASLFRFKNSWRHPLLVWVSNSWMHNITGVETANYANESWPECLRCRIWLVVLLVLNWADLSSTTNVFLPEETAIYSYNVQINGDACYFIPIPFWHLPEKITEPTNNHFNLYQ